MLNINNVAGKNQYSAVVGELKDDKGVEQKSNRDSVIEIKDEYIPSQEKEKSATYKKPAPKPDRATIQALKEESERTYSQLIEMVRQLLERQGMTFKDLAELDSPVEIDEETRLKANEMIGEDGPLSPEKVSDNIVSFAKAISGGDKGKIDTLISAIEKGFKEAAKILGGELPDISKKTYDLVMEKIEAWRNE